MTLPDTFEPYPDYPDYPQPPVEDEPRRMPLPILETVGFLMILAAILLLAREVGVFKARPHVLPAASMVDDVSVAGLSAADAEARIRQMYSTQITVLYQDQAIGLDPA